MLQQCYSSYLHACALSTCIQSYRNQSVLNYIKDIKKTEFQLYYSFRGLCGKHRGWYLKTWTAVKKTFTRRIMVPLYIWPNLIFLQLEIIDKSLTGYAAFHSAIFNLFLKIFQFKTFKFSESIFQTISLSFQYWRIHWDFNIKLQWFWR